jgi:hypothetical protein
LLEALPIKTAALTARPSNTLLATDRVNSGLKTQDVRLSAELPERSKPSGARTSKTVKIAKLDKRALPSRGPQVVWDYELLNSQTDYTLRGDTTYYVSGTVILGGTTTIEGCAVVKFAPHNPGVYIQFNGTVRCLTGPYRPAIFTARDDNTVGEIVPGSTGTPLGYYASTVFYGPNWPAGDLHKINAVQVRLHNETLDPSAQPVMLNYRQATCGWFSDLPHNGAGITEAVLSMLYAPGYCTCP